MGREGADALLSHIPGHEVNPVLLTSLDGANMRQSIPQPALAISDAHEVSADPRHRQRHGLR